MAKIFTILALFFSTSICSKAQSSQIICSSHKETYKINGIWGQWPSYWTTFKSEGGSNPIVRITTISEDTDGNIYYLKLIIDGIIEEDLFVIYDSNKTAQVRKDWNDEYVNCYVDENDDYIYTQKVSLQSLARDPTEWSKMKIQCFIFGNFPTTGLWLFADAVFRICRIMNES